MTTHFYGFQFLKNLLRSPATSISLAAAAITASFSLPAHASWRFITTIEEANRQPFEVQVDDSYTQRLSGNEYKVKFAQLWPNDIMTNLYFAYEVRMDCSSGWVMYERQIAVARNEGDFENFYPVPEGGELISNDGTTVISRFGNYGTKYPENDWTDYVFRDICR